MTTAQRGGWRRIARWRPGGAGVVRCHSATGDGKGEEGGEWAGPRVRKADGLREFQSG
jgi:hypothetical protein